MSVKHRALPPRVGPEASSAGHRWGAWGCGVLCGGAPGAAGRARCLPCCRDGRRRGQVCRGHREAQETAHTEEQLHVEGRCLFLRSF